MGSDSPTSVDAVVLVEVVDCIEHLSDRLGSVFLSELALFANAVEELSSGCKLGYDVVLVLRLSATSTPHL